MTISAVIITKNAENDIRRCLQSVAWCDEIIVLDSGSQDNTAAICREFTEKVFVTDWPGFGKQKNRALSYVTSEWVIALDSDEYLDEKLIEEIKQMLKASQCNAYHILRRSNFCGRFIKWGMWRSDQPLRLFRKLLTACTETDVHEEFRTQGLVGHLKNVIWHNAMPTLDIALDKMNRYTSLSAQMKVKQGKHGGLGKALLHGFWAFFRSYFLKLGFLDGAEGFILAVNVAEISYYRYLKMKYKSYS